ncbi:11659_t:CDS:2 [Cetraspora pellucida]|uniref:11659_t:CDS:1 n=1 Tax=Cetraspora pellucida TaxID=1433469 RepID=A0ACA9NF32_9GLOM|nr:11659_t:CDS:2 [Cetraspora pellucida]
MSCAAASTSNIIDNNASEDESIIFDNHDSLNSQYFVNFVYNKHKETIIDHVIDNNDMDEEDLFNLIQEALDDESNRNKRITRSQLIQKNISKSPPKSKQIAYITQNFNLPVSQFSPENHLVE